MRRIAALLLVLVFGLAQAAATECPMGSAAGSSAPVRHAAHQHGHHPSDHGDAGHTGHAPASCGIVTSCGAAVVPAPHVAVAQPPVYRAGPLGRLPHLYLSPVLAIDSPPPRAALQA
ncbi:MAG: hypothetical protein ACJ8J0_23950 [Longimicrobiaceae bacterium]